MEMIISRRWFFNAHLKLFSFKYTTHEHIMYELKLIKSISELRLSELGHDLKQ